MYVIDPGERPPHDFVYSVAFQDVRHLNLPCLVTLIIGQHIPLMLLDGSELRASRLNCIVSLSVVEQWNHGHNPQAGDDGVLWILLSSVSLTLDPGVCTIAAYLLAVALDLYELVSDNESSKEKEDLLFLNDTRRTEDISLRYSLTAGSGIY